MMNFLAPSSLLLSSSRTLSATSGRHYFVGIILLSCLTSFLHTAPTAPANENREGHYGSSNLDLLNSKATFENRQSGSNLQDEDVLELDNLKNPQQDELLINLEKQLFNVPAAAAAAAHQENVGQREQEDVIVQEQPSDISQDGGAVDASKTDTTIFHNKEPEDGGADTNPSFKKFHGAARLTFGQNPEPAASAEYLLRHSGGQYSSLDMAQYVFWTGDEESVARTVEEFIQKGLMTRENAIKFLRDISMGIEYLENSYANRAQQGDQPQQQQPSQQQRLPMMDLTTTTKTPTTTSKSTINRFNINQQQQQPPTISPAIQKAIIQNLPSLLKLNAENVNKKDNQADYDEINGRLRLADFLYAEYSLEEVIYQLAKVMFSQSLTKGSQQAQIALQRLTGFLEAEGAHGRISPMLQKKVLDVLLTALADCLAEHPNLMPAARAGLGNAIDRLPSKHLLGKSH